MIRYLLTILLAISLLACPLRCLSFCAGSVESATPKSTGCGCCAAPSESPQQPKPAEDDCGCGNCICHGAVCNVEFASDGEFSHALADSAAVTDQTEVRCFAGLLGGSDERISVLHGRAARIARQSLLI